MKNALIIEGSNQGFGFGNNRCLETVNTEYTLLLNSDASIDTESLARLVAFMDSNQEYAGVQPLVRLWGWGKVTVSCGVYLTEYGEAWDSRFMHLELQGVQTPLQTPAITAAVSLWRTRALRSVDGFDEKFFMYFEDADLSLRLCAAGWKLAVVRAATATHMVGASSRRQSAIEWELESSIRLFRKYIGQGRLSFRWWKREARIFLHSLFHAKSPFRRVALISRALKEIVEIVPVSEDIKAIVFGDPLDFPLHRIEENSIGPGWKGNVASPWGGLRTDGGPISFKLTALDHTVTGAVSSDRGEMLSRFCIPAGATRQIRFAKSPPLVYIHCDSSSDRVEVETE